MLSWMVYLFFGIMLILFSEYVKIRLIDSSISPVFFRPTKRFKPVVSGVVIPHTVLGRVLAPQHPKPAV